MSNRLGCTVANFRCYPSHNILENYLILLNNGYLTSDQTVILECVERSLIRRFSRFNESNPFESYQDLPEREVLYSEETPHKPFLNLYFSWIRLSIGYQNPVRRFSLAMDCFTHKWFSHTLYIYNSKKARDGDLLWEGISVDKKKRAANNIKKMIDYSEKKGINLIILIACDKYDAYEPWIKNNHPKNPTLDNLPTDRRVFNSRECLRNAIGKGIKDVYKLNNTHWSVVGADIIGNNIYECIMANNLLPEANNHKQHPVGGGDSPGDSFED